jgi:hypothetical protein
MQKKWCTNGVGIKRTGEGRIAVCWDALFFALLTVEKNFYYFG